MKAILIALALLAPTVAGAADLAAEFRQVCESPAIKSDKLTTACKADEAPDAVKAGDRFKNVGIGAEVNTLAANLVFFVKG